MIKVFHRSVKILEAYTFCHFKAIKFTQFYCRFYVTDHKKITLYSEVETKWFLFLILFRKKYHKSVVCVDWIQI